MLPYGAGGGTSKNTVKIASHIKNDLKIPALAHLTCVSSTKEEVHKVIGQLQKEGIENILALRGDIPQDGQFPLPGQYSHACELIEDIKKNGRLLHRSCMLSGRTCRDGTQER